MLRNLKACKEALELLLIKVLRVVKKEREAQEALNSIMPGTERRRL